MIVIGSKNLSSFLVIRSLLCWVYCVRIRRRTVRQMMLLRAKSGKRKKEEMKLGRYYRVT
jgi:hypothetical protein